MGGVQALKADTDKKIKAVAVVHNETATGVTSDLPKIRETIDACNHPALFMVDGVSSIGALDFQMDKWKVDIAVTGSQKALSLPTGLAIVAVSDKVNQSSCCGRLLPATFQAGEFGSPRELDPFPKDWLLSPSQPR